MIFIEGFVQRLPLLKSRVQWTLRTQSHCRKLGRQSFPRRAKLQAFAEASQHGTSADPFFIEGCNREDRYQLVSIAPKIIEPKAI